MCKRLNKIIVGTLFVCVGGVIEKMVHWFTTGGAEADTVFVTTLIGCAGLLYAIEVLRKL